MNNTNSTRVIKRYTNRKLYDTIESRYVTLEEITKMVKDGLEIQIIDNQSGKDLTTVTLAQILVEEQKKQDSGMPLGLLKEIIRSSGSTISDFFQRKVAHPVQTIKEEAERRVDELKKKSETTVEGTSRQIREFVSHTQKMLDDVQKRLDDRLHALMGAVGAKTHIKEQLRSLRKRIEELESKFGE